jgi:Uma2 family endonuclease
MVATKHTYEEIALTEAGRRLELHQGVMREKPAMSFGHNRVQRRLNRVLLPQLDPAEFELSVDASRVRRSEETYYIPDLCVIPTAYTDAYDDRPRALEVYDSPLPLVIEIWSPSTGSYDVEGKLPEYQRRGDLEIWRLHPFDRTLIAWRRQPDGSYTETTYTGGTVQPVALPGVTIDLDALFL